MTGVVTATLSSNFTTLTTGAGKDVVTGYEGKMVLDTGDGSDTLKFLASADLSGVTGASLKGVDLLDLSSIVVGTDTGSANTNDITMIFKGSQVDASVWAIKGAANTSTAAKDTVKVYMDGSSLNLSNWSIDTATVNSLVIDGGSNSIADSDARTEGLTITATATADGITVGNNGSTVNAGAGDDTVTGGTGADVVNGGDGADTINADAGNDTIDGGAGNDRITAGSGNDVVNGGTGNDGVDAGSGNDTVNGGTGNDSIVGGSGVDTIDGSDGNDFIVGGTGADVLTGGAGYDVFAYATGYTGTVAATTAGTVSVAQVATLTVSGTYAAGEVVRLTAGTGVHAYTVKAGDSSADIAKGLAASTATGTAQGTVAQGSGDNTDKVIFTAAAASATQITVATTVPTAVAANSDSGVTVTGTAVTGFDQIALFSSTEDSILLGGSNAKAAAVTTAPTATQTVGISTGGKVSFATADDTLSEKVTALVNDNTNVGDAKVVFFEDNGNTYVYGAGTTADTSTDFLIELVGVTGLTTATISSGSLTFA